jgi:hypothetical protein
MSELKVNKVSPKTGTAITLGDSGDTFTVPSGATLTVASGATLTASNATMTGFTIPSGQTLTIASGATLANSGTATGFAAGGPAKGTAPSSVYRTNAKVQNENLVLSDHSTTFTATNATNVLNVGTDDDFANDNNVRLTTSGSDLPDGWAIDTDYYVIGATSSTMQIATTVGGAAVTIADDGSGTHTVFEVINAMASGPITIKTGNSLTIPSGSRVVII